MLLRHWCYTVQPTASPLLAPSGVDRSGLLGNTMTFAPNALPGPPPTASSVPMGSLVIEPAPDAVPAAPVPGEAPAAGPRTCNTALPRLRGLARWCSQATPSQALGLKGKDCLPAQATQTELSAIRLRRVQSVIQATGRRPTRKSHDSAEKTLGIVRASPRCGNAPAARPGALAALRVCVPAR